MTPPKRAVTGRPSKGDRHVFTTRIPEPQASKLIAIAEALDLTYSEWISGIVLRELETIDLNKLTEEGTLPIKHVS